MRILATNRGFLTVYMATIAALTIAAGIPMHFLNTGSTLFQLLLIPFWYTVMGIVFMWSYTKCREEGDVTLTTYYMTYKGIKFLVTLVFILASAFLIEYDLVAFMVIFLVFFLVLTLVETLHFLEVERKLKQS